MGKLKTIVCVGVCLFFRLVATGATWYVDGSREDSGDGQSPETAFKRVQEGINGASNGDTVVVAEGTYFENIDFEGKNIVLRSTDPQDSEVVSRTVIDGNGEGPVVTFAGTEDETCVLSGLTIQNGRADRGGGIFGKAPGSHSRATIENNVITANTARRGGGLFDCDGTIQDNTISGNRAEESPEWGSLYVDGGGLAYCDGTIKNNTVRGNTAEQQGGGFFECNGSIQDNTISENSAVYGGGLIFCDGVIQNNTVMGNWAEREGGGFAYCDAEVRKNTITDNTAYNNEGAGLAYCNGTIYSNVISGNTAHFGAAMSDCDGTIRNNVISSNSSFMGAAMTFCDGTIKDNKITGNSAEYGGAFYFCHGTIQGNTISGNSVKHDGGALFTCWATVQNNVIAGNRAGDNGGAFASCGGPMQNNTIVENSAVRRGGALYRCRGTIGNSILWGNTAWTGKQVAESATPIFSCIEEWSGGEGNIATDPQFVDAPGGDYHLQAGSPCIDAGANYYWFAWPQCDMSGNCRVANGRVDMGCYEYGGTHDTDGDLLSDINETAAGTSVQNEDTDGDGLRDGLEVLRGSHPLIVTPPRVVHVPEDIPRIQASLLLAVHGEDIVVAPGRYRETLHFSGINVILRSSDPANPGVVSSTILDGDQAGPAVCFSGKEKDVCVVSGFTITGGLADRGGGIHGGRLENTSHATIENNVVTGNSASYGGGIHSCDGIIRNNTVSDNSAERWGGGLYWCNGSVQNNVIRGNSAGGSGGGLFGCDGTIVNNIVVANKAEGTYVWRDETFGAGGGMCTCNGAIWDNVVVNNQALKGGGLYKCNGSVQNNTIVGNSADDSGGGLESCTGTIAGCIIFGNTVAGGEGEQVYESRTPSYCCIQDWPGGGEGNIAPPSPGFVDADGADDDPETYEDNNYRLSNDSPCIDAGRNEGWMVYTVDLGGNPRILQGISAPTVDMGAYEYVPPEAASGIWYVDGSVAGSGDGTSWETALQTVQEGIEIALDGNTVIVARGTYRENIRFGGKNIVIRSSDALDAAVVAATILDGNRVGPTITFDGTEPETCALAGFTIRSGTADYGGGICGGTAGQHTHARIENNVITSNRAGYGGGVAFCDGLIQNNTISWNYSTYDYGEGGGLTLCNGLIQGNVIYRNSSVWRGGGLSRCNGTIQNNVVSRNSASSGGGLAYCDGRIEGNSVFENSATVQGGGLYFCRASIRSNTITGNTAGSGGGLALCDGAIRNDTIVENSAENTGGGLAWCNGTIRNCIIWNNTAINYAQLYQSRTPTYCCIGNWTEGGEGNISPPSAGFVDADGADNDARSYQDNDYRLWRDSPCIDKGKNEDWMRDAVDMDGNPRIFYGTSSATVDMGAYEWDSFLFKIAVVVKATNGDVLLTWSSRPDDSYAVWSCADLSTREWAEEEIVPSAGAMTFWTDHSSSGGMKIYRVEMRQRQ